MIFLAYMLVTFVAYFIGQAVTERLVAPGGWWSRPVFRGWRRWPLRANLPVGGVLFGAIAAAAPERLEPWPLCIAIGFAASAMLWDADE